MAAARSENQLELIPRNATIGEAKIECPHCRGTFRLNETLAAPLVEETRRKLAMELEEKEVELEQRLKEKEGELEQRLKANDAKLAEARKAELEFRKKQRDLDEKLKDAELDVEKRLAAALEPERAKAKREAEEQQRLKLAEKEKVISDLQLKLTEAIRKSEQGSQQMQGEVQELDLERRLRESFPRDTIDPVPKGQFGGDTLHRVLSAQGELCGTLLWESKRTKNWSPAWIDKLKQDQRASKADLAVIVTQAMPPGIESFAEVDGIWVTTPLLAIALAAALRLGLAEAFVARRAAHGQQDKMAVLYQYMTGPRFRQRLEAIKDAFTNMQQDLEAEKRVMTKQWAKRAQQIERVMGSSVGIYGDVQAIAGSSLLEIEGLELRSLPTSDAPTAEDGDLPF